MKLKTRILILMLVFVILALFTGAITFISQNAQIGSILQANTLEKSKIVKSIFDNQKQQVVGYTSNYSGWDELISFVKNKNFEWAKINLDPSLVSFDNNILWVIDLEGKTVYSAENNLKKTFELPIPKDKLKNYLRKNKEGHFFIFSDNTLI